jgi:ketosteroid isomerase-like protein
MVILAISILAARGTAQTTQPVTGADPTAAIDRMRTALIDSFNNKDLPGLLSHLDPDVVVTWQNGEVCRGPDAVRDYYNKMMTGPNPIVASVHADPKVTDRHIYGDWAVSWGEMHDHFNLTDGSDLDMNSKFTATIAKRGDEWKVTSFHLSVDAFDNAILKTAVVRTATWAGGLSGGAALVVGFLAGWLLKRRKVA